MECIKKFMEINKLFESIIYINNYDCNTNSCKRRKEFFYGNLSKNLKEYEKYCINNK
jgi:hypothetical protein